MRVEKDFIGERQIEDNALYGIHSLRARENFPDSTRFSKEWYQAVGTVKQACYLTYKDFATGIRTKYKNSNHPISLIEDNIINALISSADEVAKGIYFDHFIVPAVSGGAGTSINMNVNEILTNASLLKLVHNPGDYKIVDPIEHANIYQSTNDVIPTSLKVALMHLFNQLEDKINELRSTIEGIEKKSRNYLRIGYTQMQEAVPSSYGRLFGAYNDALSRDWWRVSKCMERIKTVNLGGSAIGSGLTVPAFFIRESIRTLQKITGLPISRAENMFDATSNLDALVEVHAIIKSHAVNLEKMVSDLRLLSSDILNTREVIIPKKQAGSSIMPGKVNPVIPEYVISVAHKVYANDALISSLCSQGCLELNAYLPVIGHAIIESLKLLIGADETLDKNLFAGLELDPKTAYNKLICSPSVTTALIPFIGYNNATRLALRMKDKQIDIFEANKLLGIISETKLKEIIQPENLLKEGFTLKDLG